MAAFSTVVIKKKSSSNLSNFFKITCNEADFLAKLKGHSSGVYLIDFKTYARPYCVKEAVMKFPQGS